MQFLSLVGYHGTCCENADSIIKHGFRISKSDNDWLGDGVYFFVEGLSSEPEVQAAQWAKAQAWDQKKKEYSYNDYCVIESTIDVKEEELLDLTTEEGLKIFEYVIEKFKRKISRLKQSRKLEYIEGLVLNMARNEGWIPYKVVKGSFYIKFSEERIMKFNRRINNCTICAVCFPGESISESSILTKETIK